ncbi:MAG TPA: hypothetical protein VLJ39_07625 [Tepidisphaeraceae bacterium]|nr:hypothetical protein [Tepidisphaeraceae bacterium]
MSRNDKKQRREAKRKAKRQQIRKQSSVSPTKRLADARGEVEGWMSEDFELHRQVQLFVWKRAAGLTGIACFLVDQGVVGLKDAWTRLGVVHDEFEEMIDQSERRGISMLRTEPEEVRRWVAGGVRWAHDNGMRLPKDWTKAAAFVGGVGDWATADVSQFQMEFAGHPDDLRQRLIGDSLQNYLQRTDIRFIFNEAAPYMDQETGEYVDDEDDSEEDEFDDLLDEFPEEQMEELLGKLTAPALALVVRTVAWLSARGETPSSELLEAWRSTMLGAMLSRLAMPDADDEELGEFGYDLMKSVSQRIEPSRFVEYQRAFGQVLQFLETDPTLMRTAMLEHGMSGEAPPETDEEE